MQPAPDLNVAIVVLVNHERGAVENIWSSRISAVLREQGVETRIFALREESEQLADLLDHLSEFEPGLVHFPMYDYNNLRANFDSYSFVDRYADVAAEIRTSDVDAHVNCGGQYVAFIYERLAQYYDLFDSFIVGEPEETMPDLVARLDENESLDGCEGLHYTDDGELIENGRRPPIRDLDDLPFMDRDLLTYQPARIAASRGCLGGCSFCTVSKFAEIQRAGWRGRSPDDVVDEIERLHDEFDIDVIEFNDASFADPGPKGKRRAKAIFEELIDREVEVLSSVFVRADTLSREDRDLLRTMERAGVYRIFTGIEAASDHLLEKLDKPATTADNFRTADMIQGTGIDFKAGFIMFTPYTRLDDVRKGLRFLRQYGQACWFSVWSELDVVPGSRIEEQLEADGLLRSSYDYANTRAYEYEDPAVPEVRDAVDRLFSGEPERLEHVVRDTDEFLRYVEFKLEDPYEIPAFRDLEQTVELSRKAHSSCNYRQYQSVLDIVEDTGTIRDDELDSIQEAYDDELRAAERTATVQQARRRLAESIEQEDVDLETFLREPPELALDPVHVGR